MSVTSEEGGSWGVRPLPPRAAPRAVRPVGGLPAANGQAATMTKGVSGGLKPIEPDPSLPLADGRQRPPVDEANGCGRRARTPLRDPRSLLPLNPQLFRINPTQLSINNFSWLTPYFLRQGCLPSPWWLFLNGYHENTSFVPDIKIWKIGQETKKFILNRFMQKKEKIFLLRFHPANQLGILTMTRSRIRKFFPLRFNLIVQ